MAEQTKAELQALLTEATKRAEAGEKTIARLTTDLATANERADQASAAAKAAEAKAADLDKANAGLSKSLRAYKGSATKARAEAEVLKAEKSPAMRKIGRMGMPADADGRKELDALIAAALDAGPVSIAFSDGKREIRELAPLIVSGGAWRKTPRGQVLDAEPLLDPGKTDKPELSIAGFGLLNEQGDQIAWHQLPEPIRIAGGTRMKLPRGTIRF